MVCSRRALFAALALRLCCVPTGADAQSVRLYGNVTDTAGRVIPEVSIRVISTRDELAGTTRTDPVGAYSVFIPISDTVRVIARRIGFAPYESRTIVGGGAMTRHDIVLQPVAQSLIGVEIRAATNRSAFAERATADIKHAYFADSALLSTKDRRSITTLFDQLSSMGIRMGIPRRIRPRYRTNEIPLRKGGMLEQLVGTDGCAVNAYVDGWWTRTSDLTRAVSAHDIAGIEVYSAADQAPLPYRDLDPLACTVVLIWTDAGMDWEPAKP